MIHLAMSGVTPNQVMTLLERLCAGRGSYSLDRVVREGHPLDRKVWYVEHGQPSSLAGHVFVALGVDPVWLVEHEEWNPYPLWESLRQVPRLVGDDMDVANIINTVWVKEHMEAATWGACLRAARFEHLAVINRQRIGKDF